MWRTVIVSKGEKLTVKNNWLYVYSDEFEHHIPIDDIYALVIDNHSAMLSVDVLSSLSSSGAHIYYCDRNHLPVAVTYTLNSFYKPLLTAKKQMSMTKEQKDNLWNLIVRQKIINQSLCLNYCGVNKQSSSEIKSLALNIVDGDKTNREAVAAKKYFRFLFGSMFKRSDDDITNSALDYGYAIIRSCVAKTLAVHGYIGTLGLHHINEGNPFNLADDLMEPLRPLVDMWVDSNCDELFNRLTSENKKGLISLVNNPIRIDGKKMRVRYAIDVYIKSLTSAINKDNPNLLMLPELLPLEPFFEDEQDG